MASVVLVGHGPPNWPQGMIFNQKTNKTKAHNHKDVEVFMCVRNNRVKTWHVNTFAPSFEA